MYNIQREGEVERERERERKKKRKKNLKNKKDCHINDMILNLTISQEL